MTLFDLVLGWLSIFALGFMAGCAYGRWEQRAIDFNKTRDWLEND